MSENEKCKQCEGSGEGRKVTRKRSRGRRSILRKISSITTVHGKEEVKINWKEVVKMMIVVVSIFAVCWLPFHAYFIFTSVMPEITNHPSIQDIYLAIYWLAMSNSMYNPIIYCWMNHRFRRGFKQFFSCCPFVHLTPDKLLTRREAVTSRYNSCSGSPDAHYRIVRND
ncbi:hypothetical protein LSTR_LSTR012162 [Laodelphax striatellus]|uniref:G-protein coupled receptors family 1 profile domain-containing protein n=1 Tax=Laodelphax striatellus TaxID=195883 RepID=A0A482X0P9_LAOST|nr:hypothetical protein LSTR_LSTR012162 [Laodelphax striatellus]